MVQDDQRAIEDVKALNFSEENGGEFAGSKEIAQSAADAGIAVDPSMLPQQPTPAADPSLEQKLAATTVAVGTMGPMGLMSMGIAPPSPSDPTKV